jgi:hypothetical protein
MSASHVQATTLLKCYRWCWYALPRFYLLRGNSAVSNTSFPSRCHAFFSLYSKLEQLASEAERYNHYKYFTPKKWMCRSRKSDGFLKVETFSLLTRAIYMGLTRRITLILDQLEISWSGCDQRQKHLTYATENTAWINIIIPLQAGSEIRYRNEHATESATSALPPFLNCINDVCIRFHVFLY